jgi:hypothetical protein
MALFASACGALSRRSVRKRVRKLDRRWRERLGRAREFAAIGC